MLYVFYVVFSAIVFITLIRQSDLYHDWSLLWKTFIVGARCGGWVDAKVKKKEKEKKKYTKIKKKEIARERRAPPTPRRLITLPKVTFWVSGRTSERDLSRANGKVIAKKIPPKLHTFTIARD